MPDAIQPALSFDQLKDRNWRFFRESGLVASVFFKFLPDGTVGGYHHHNERYWRIENGVLSLLNKNKVVTVTFESVEIDSGKILLKGKHVPSPAIILCLEYDSSSFTRPKHNVTKNALSNDIKQFGWSIGDHTYGVPHIVEKGMARLFIGKYCSIAAGVNIALGNHRLDTFTTYPFKVLQKFWEHVPADTEDHLSKGDVVIGNDVWIGTNVFIGSGVNIGSGAVIGAESVITKDIPPYAIVVGNPGRILRYRFDRPLVEELLELSWWDLSDEVVDSLLPLLMSNDASALLIALKQAKSASHES